MNALFVISLLGVTAMLAEIVKFKKLLPLLVLTGLVVAMGLAVIEWVRPVNIPAFHNMLVFNNYALVFTVGFCIITFLWFMLAQHQLENKTALTDHYSLILFSLAGAVLMASFGNLVMLFLGIEILSIPLYILAGSNKKSLSSNEAAFKYFLMGSFATGFLLFGVALIYGASGSFDILEISEYVLRNAGELPHYFYAGLLLIVVGLSFKVSAVPFHFWAPDVYQGAPNLITAFMLTMVKMAAFAAFFRLFSICFASIGQVWAQVITVIIASTLLLGNVTAVYQTSFKRMLAYSGISHAGYILLAILSINNYSAGAIFYYTLAYSIASITAFTVLQNVCADDENDSLENFNGLAKRNPLLALSLTVSMLSLAGIPPTAGFFAKYTIFVTALNNGHVWLVIIAVLASLVGVYYYFKPIIASYFKTPINETVIEISLQHKLLIIVTTALTLALGLFPDYIIKLFS
ncbi:MAG: NADH-quinone oxidoreductase subunit N [Bacteroidia bacterium]|nr:NADH-quinone oxidoreductase subunit N [Bacteroidia bacterium]